MPCTSGPPVRSGGMGCPTVSGLGRVRFGKPFLAGICFALPLAGPGALPGGGLPCLVQASPQPVSDSHAGLHRPWPRHPLECRDAPAAQSYLPGRALRRVRHLCGGCSGSRTACSQVVDINSAKDAANPACAPMMVALPNMMGMRRRARPTARQQLHGEIPPG